jgi:hypothetical protein
LRFVGGKKLESKMMRIRVQKTGASNITLPQREHTDAREFGNRVVGEAFSSISQSYISSGERGQRHLSSARQASLEQVDAIRLGSDTGRHAATYANLKISSSSSEGNFWMGEWVIEDIRVVSTDSSMAYERRKWQHEGDLARDTLVNP